MQVGETEKSNLRKFLQIYPGMVSYYIGEQSKRKLSKVHFQSPDTKFCTLIVMLLLLMFTCISIFLKRDVGDEFWLNQLVLNEFKPNIAQYPK